MITLIFIILLITTFIFFGFNFLFWLSVFCLSILLLLFASYQGHKQAIKKATSQRHSYYSDYWDADKSLTICDKLSLWSSLTAFFSFFWAMFLFFTGVFIGG